MTFHDHRSPRVAAELVRECARIHARRQRLEARIEAAIAALDLLDGDPDLEPSLTGCGVGGPSLGGDDREADDELNEPSLGAPECSIFGGPLYLGRGGVYRHGDQTHWAQGGLYGHGQADLEEACDDEGVDTDTEGGTDDNGIGDRCGLAEQGASPFEAFA